MKTRDVKTEINLGGMDFQQFVLFLKDTESPLVSDTKRQAAFEIYKATCEARQRERLTCEDFVEAIRKYRLAPPMEQILVAMKKRECEGAHNIRNNLARQGFAVPDVIAATATRDPLRQGDDEEGDPDLTRLHGGNRHPPGVGRGGRLKDLLALTGTAPAGGAQQEEKHKNE